MALKDTTHRSKRNMNRTLRRSIRKGTKDPVHFESTLTADGETFLNLPTVSTGTVGSLWNDGGTVKVVS